MKSHGVLHDTGRARRPVRSARRAQERAEKRQHSRRGRRPAYHLPSSGLIGGALTLLALLGVIIYTIVRMNASDATSGGLADAKALNPATSLLRVGQPAPNFTLRTANGKTYNLAAQRGHPVLLEFFAVWCPVCQGEAPVLAKITRQYVPKGVRVWSVLASPYGKNYDASGRSDLSLATRGDLSWYASKFDVRHPQLIDPQFGTVNRYGINAYPGMYVVDSKGVISFASVGHQGFSKLSMALENALGSANAGTGR